MSTEMDVNPVANPQLEVKRGPGRPRKNAAEAVKHPKRRGRRPKAHKLEQVKEFPPPKAETKAVVIDADSGKEVNVVKRSAAEMEGMTRSMRRAQSYIFSLEAPLVRMREQDKKYLPGTKGKGVELVELAIEQIRLDIEAIQADRMRWA